MLGDSVFYESRRWLELDPRLRLDAGAERVLDEGHVGHQVGGLDQLVLGVAAGDDDVQVRGLVAQNLHDFGETPMITITS